MEESASRSTAVGLDVGGRGDAISTVSSHTIETSWKSADGDKSGHGYQSARGGSAESADGDKSATSESVIPGGLFGPVLGSDETKPEEPDLPEGQSSVQHSTKCVQGHEESDLPEGLPEPPPYSGAHEDDKLQQLELCPMGKPMQHIPDARVIGKMVVISGLEQRPSLNGCWGCVTRLVPGRGRVGVRVEAQGEYSIRPANLFIIDSFTLDTESEGSEDAD